MDLLISFIRNGIVPLSLTIMFANLGILKKFKRDDTLSENNIFYLKIIIFSIILICLSNVAITFFILKEIK